jgi:transposase
VRASRRPWPKGAARATAQAGRRAGTRHGGEGFGALRRTPPVLGLIQRGGPVVLRMPADVRQATIEPVIEGAVAKGALVHTDEYAIYARLPAWGYRHKTVHHGRGEYARDEDGDGFCEVHVNTIEGFWSLLRSWLRPHRGVSQDKLPSYLGFFQFVHNARRRGKALLGALVAALVA